MSALFQACLDLLFPRHCLNCDDSLPPDFRLLCATCWQELSFSDPEEFCRSCYSPLESSHTQHCVYCRRYPSPFYRLICIYETISPSLKLKSRWEESSTSFLTKAAAALMAYRFAELDIPWPDLLIPLPIHPLNKTYKGFSPSETLTKELSHLLKVPSINALRSKGLLETSYNLAPNSHLEDQRILLVADMLTPAFFQAGEALAAGCPRLIMGLTFCHAI